MRRTLLLLSTMALAILAVPAGSSQTGAKPSRETKDRLAPEKMAALVAGPLQAAEKDDLPRARNLLDRMVEDARRRHGGASVREADLLTSFAIGLFTLGSEREQEDMLKLSLAYMKRATGATKRAFGARHPETAVALHSYADMLLQLRGDYAPGQAGAALLENHSDPSGEAEAALAEALSIRQSTLGPDNIETIGAMRSLARVKAARFVGDFDGAVELLRRAIEIATRTAPAPEDVRPARLRLVLVQVYANAGRVDEALREARIAAEEARRDDEAAVAGGTPCSFIEVTARAMADDLQASHPVEAEALRRLFPEENPCLEAIVDSLEEAVATNLAR